MATADTQPTCEATQPLRVLLQTTARLAQENHACSDGFNKVASALWPNLSEMEEGLDFYPEEDGRFALPPEAYDQPINLLTVLEHAGLEGFNWVLEAEALLPGKEAELRLLLDLIEDETSDLVEAARSPRENSKERWAAVETKTCELVRAHLMEDAKS